MGRGGGLEPRVLQRSALVARDVGKRLRTSRPASVQAGRVFGTVGVLRDSRCVVGMRWSHRGPKGRIHAKGHDDIMPEGHDGTM
jgi:hypothetical protein